jgi:DNA-directed RNA polymerase specialized sigma24 family protein
VPDGFRGFVMTRSPTLLRTAWLPAGDEATAQDLVQTALMKSWPRCDRLDHGGAERPTSNASWCRRSSPGGVAAGMANCP